MIPAAIPWKLRIELIQQIVAKISPDWISLQYSPYSFGSQGLPWRLSQYLASVKGNFRWHIMFHELWIGEEPGYTSIQKVLGVLQRLIVKKMNSRIRPICHTSNGVYRSRLESLGIKSTILPIFSNIPLVNGKMRRKVLLGELKKEHGLDVQDCWIFVIFGGIHAEWSPEPLLSKLVSLMQKAGTKASVFITLGKSGSHSHLLTEALQKYGSNGIYYLQKGEMPARMISEYLQSCDYGITTSPLHLLGKSGSVAALKEHGIPIIVTRINEGDDNPAKAAHYILMDQNFERNFLFAGKYPRVSMLDKSASQLVADLKEFME